MSKITKESKQTYYEVDIRNIEPTDRAGGNPRFDFGDEAEIKESIRQNGIIEPMRGYRSDKDRNLWFITSGHRRLKLAKEISAETGVAVMAKMLVLDRRTLKDEDILNDFLTPNTGKPLNALEIADTIKRLIALGKKPKDVAKSLGKSITEVKSLLALNDAPEELKEMLVKKQVSYTLVKDLMNEHKNWEAVTMGLKKFQAMRKEQNGEPEGKITKEKLNKATGRVNSFRCLKDFYKENKSRTFINQDLHDFIKLLCTNKLGPEQIAKYFI